MGFLGHLHLTLDWLGWHAHQASQIDKQTRQALTWDPYLSASEACASVTSRARLSAESTTSHSGGNKRYLYRLLSIWELGQKARAGGWLELRFPAQGGKAHSDLPPQSPPILGWLIVVLFINLLKDVNRVIVALYDINNLMSPCYLFMEWIMRSLQGPDIILQSGNSTAAIKHTHK